MKTLPIAETLALPLDGRSGSPGAVTQKYAFLGRTGSGKTYAATKLAELLLEARAQVVALDPVGVWPFLRIPGAGAAFELPVLGGLYGDVPLESTGGELVADFLASTRASAVLDVSQFTGAEQRRFAAAFATRFFQRWKAEPGPVQFFLEECQEFVPQNGGGEVATMLGAFERLVKLGRNFGIGVSLISQRPQEVNKKALNQTECLFAFQMTGPQERKAIAAWAADKGLDVDLVAALPRLPVGNARVWSPQWLDFSGQVKIAQKRTSDGSATPTSAARGGFRLAPIDLGALREAMAATVERTKTDDPKALKARVAELERQLRERPAAEARVERVEVPVVPPAVYEAINRMGEAHEAAGASIRAAVEACFEVRKAAGEARANASTITCGENCRACDREPPRGPVLALEGAPKPTLKERARRAATTPATPGTPPEGWTMEEEALYQKIKARLLEEAPALVKAFATGAELEVTVERKVVQLDGSSMKGRIAVLIARGFTDTGKRNGELVKELGRTGPTAHPARVSEALLDLVAMGIVTREGDRYQKSPGAKVTTREIASG